MAISQQISKRKRSRPVHMNPPAETHLFSYIAKSRDILSLHRICTAIASYFGSGQQPRAHFLVDLLGVIYHRVQDGYDDEARSSLLARLI